MAAPTGFISLLLTGFSGFLKNLAANSTRFAQKLRLLLKPETAALGFSPESLLSGLNFQQNCHFTMTLPAQNCLSVRELQAPDIPLLANYWLTSEPVFLISMGVDLQKRPTYAQFTGMLQNQLATPLEQKRAYCLIWEENGQPIGHCNTNPTTFGHEAFMHLHLWRRETRNKGLGLQLVQLSLPHFFQNLQLEKLISEPYALNPAPHKTLQKAGFSLVKEYVTVPGSLNFEQPVKRWELTAAAFRANR